MDNHVHSLGGKAKARKIYEAYNKNPNKCKFCKKPILFDGSTKFTNVRNKSFCNSSCAASYNNLRKNEESYKISAYKKSKIYNLSDSYIKQCYEDCVSISDFMRRLGLKSSSLTVAVEYKLNKMNLDIKKLKEKHNLLRIKNTTTKEELLNKCTYQSYRTYIQRDARRTYINSSKPKICYVCGYDKHIDVAHIKPVSSFEDNTLIKDINSLDNLIALCPNHHWEYDNNLLNL